MTPPTEHLLAVLDAAETLLDRRKDQMVTIAEWDALAEAVHAANRPEPTQPGEVTRTFAVDGPELVLSIVPADGAPYRATCPEAVFKQVAHGISDMRGQPFTLESLMARLRIGQQVAVPWCQVVTALAFLNQRGITVPVHGRKHKASGPRVYADAMNAYHALRDGRPGE